MRTYEESMAVLTALLDRHPGSDLVLIRQRTDWRARIWILDTVGDTRRVIIDAVSCESEKALDSLASKTLETTL